MKAWIHFLQVGVLMGTLVQVHLIALETVTAVHLCFLSTEMEYPVDYTCKQYKQK